MEFATARPVLTRPYWQQRDPVQHRSEPLPIPSASAHLHVRTHDGKIKTIGEFVAPHLPAYEFAEEVVRRFVAPQTNKGSRRRIVAVYLDPANFKNIGDGHTIANQINEVLEPYDLGVLPASNDRIGGWELM